MRRVVAVVVVTVAMMHHLHEMAVVVSLRLAHLVTGLVRQCRA
ncbi:MAG: hypothetical protein JWR07_2422, partial [Nevskia sp.]|nr:hypothetical protein [Nevskia sp.]